MIYHSAFPYTSRFSYDNAERHAGKPLIHVCDRYNGSKGVHWQFPSPLHEQLYPKIKSLKGQWDGSDWVLSSKAKLERFCSYAQSLGALAATADSQPFSRVSFMILNAVSSSLLPADS